MNEIKAIIADNDESLVSHLEALLSDVWPDLVISGKARNGPEAFKLIHKHEPHLAFLEVRIPGICGMQVARKIAGVCWVVFITAHDHYAVNAFESGAVDYIIKPVNRERLEKAVTRLKKQIALSSTPPQYFSQVVEKFIAELPERKTNDYLQWIRVQQDDGVLLIPVEKVCYFRAGDKYTAVVTQEGESLIKKPIKELADELDPNRYWRIHRGAIVNVSQIDKVSRSVTGRGAVRLKDRPEVLTVSRPYLHIFKQM
jgi:DNA-binding LytR/AlgR family response regulator